jgi:hypothetical protein
MVSVPRQRVTRKTVAVALLVLGLGVTAWAAEALLVSTLTRDGRLLVTFELFGGYTDERRAGIQSGLQTTFRYDVALRRAAAFWPDAIVASSTLSATVRYDNLTEQYSIARLMDGHVEETVVVEEEDLVRAWLTHFERVPLFSTDDLEPNGEYSVRVRAETRPRQGWFVLPWGWADASGDARFTFLP